VAVLIIKWLKLLIIFATEAAGRVPWGDIADKGAALPPLIVRFTPDILTQGARMTALGNPSGKICTADGAV